MKNIKILLLSGDKRRHKYWTLKLLKKFPSAKLIIEKQPKNPWGAHVKSPTPLMKQHFNDFEKTEKALFDKFIINNKVLLRKSLIDEINEGEINSPEIITKIKKINPDIILVLSTSLLSEEFIQILPHKIINFHAGLSPYYRGSGTNIFPFYNKELEYVGVTIHYIDSGIDSGNVIIQGRPVFEENDNTHTVGCKNIDVGVNLMTEIANNFKNKGLPLGHKQNLKVGKLYYRKDFTDETIYKIRQNLVMGIVRDYVKIQPLRIKIIDKITYE